MARDREDIDEVEDAIEGATLDMVDDKVEVEWFDCIDKRE